MGWSGAYAILLGRVIDYPAGQSFKDGSLKTYFQLETNESWTNRNGEIIDNIQRHNIVIIGKRAIYALKYLLPNTTLYLEGRLKKRKWFDQWNRECTILEVQANWFQNLEYSLQDGDWNDLELYNMKENNSSTEDFQQKDDSIPF